MSLPLSLRIVATDKSHPEEGSKWAAISACGRAANDFPILGRPLALLASTLLDVSESLRDSVLLLLLYMVISFLSLMRHV